jgi:cobalt/nickel transport system permease protein
MAINHHKREQDGENRQRLLGNLPAGWKLATTLVMLLTVALAPRRGSPVLYGLGAILLILLGVSRIPIRVTLRRMALLEPLVLGVGGLMLFQPEGGRLFLGVLIKANLCLLIAHLLAQTTRFTDLIAVLRRVRIPWIFITTLTLMHRYVSVLSEESERMRRAGTSRTFTAGKRVQWKNLSSVVGRLFVRASERADRIYSAMCARGWR